MKAIRRGVFNSVVELEAAIASYLANQNAKPTPFVWTKSADIILAKVERARATLVAVKTGEPTVRVGTLAPQVRSGKLHHRSSTVLRDRVVIEFDISIRHAERVRSRVARVVT